MTSTDDNPVSLLAYGDDPLERAAARVLDRCAPRLPLLDDVIVLMPDLQAAPRLREHLLGQAGRMGHEALLGPRIDTLRAWVESLRVPGIPAVRDSGRELMLVEALQQYPDLFGEPNPWRLCDSLIELFDELTLHQGQLPDDLQAFTGKIKQGYAIRGEAPRHLGQETGLIHTLWTAWHRQLDEEGKIDPHAAYILRLRHALDLVPEHVLLFLVGFHELTSAEALWLKSMLQHGRAELILHGRAEEDGYHPDAPLHRLADSLGITADAEPSREPLARCLDAVFTHRQQPLAERARAFARHTPDSPLQDRVTLFEADDTEQEAHAVDLQVRRWLLAGKSRIGIVTEDRRLARRVRALLERADVPLQDTGGWALSTTSAAAALERWLETIEEDFAHRPLMDFLKSPFLLPPDDPEGFRLAVFRLEQDIILHENIARGLARYRKHIAYRGKRLKWTGRAMHRVVRLLDDLGNAAAPLLSLHDGKAHRPLHFLDALQESLNRLGLQRSFDTDPAGYRVLQQLERLRTAVMGRELKMNWLEFRSWLGRTLEQANFRPMTSNSPVQLLSLSQSLLCRFDGVIIAAAERDFLPGTGGRSPYFNDTVRHELGLPGWHETLTTRLYHFRRLLECAPGILLTRRREQDGEEIVASPWLEALHTFHRIAYGADLLNRTLARLVRDERSQVFLADTTQRPPAGPRPRPRVPASQLPQTLSAGAHQRLIDCPYQFFGGDCLGLKPIEEVREALEKSDYGERVHRCLQAFHGDVDDLPGPFPEPVAEHNRERAVACLREISAAQFAQDLEDNFMHRGWLRRWLELIPLYIDWQIQRQPDWQVAQVESSRSTTLAPDRRLKGRLDRVDARPRTDGAVAIVDYKTGSVPGEADVREGEAIQLPSYALLMESVERVEYLQMDAGRVKAASPLEGEALADLRDQVGQRLEQLLAAIGSGTALPAWGDEKTCRRCSMGGICRQQAWTDAPTDPDRSSP